MEAALYDADGGYYAVGRPIGPVGDFITASDFGEADDLSVSTQETDAAEVSAASGSDGGDLFGAADQDLRSDSPRSDAAAPVDEEVSEALPEIGEPGESTAGAAEPSVAEAPKPERMPASAGPGLSRIAPPRPPQKAPPNQAREVKPGGSI